MNIVKVGKIIGHNLKEDGFDFTFTHLKITKNGTPMDSLRLIGDTLYIGDTTIKLEGNCKNAMKQFALFAPEALKNGLSVWFKVDMSVSEFFTQFGEEISKLKGEHDEVSSHFIDPSERDMFEVIGRLILQSSATGCNFYVEDNTGKLFIFEGGFENE